MKKEYAVLKFNPEFAVTDREGLAKDAMFTKWLLYQKSLKEINSKPEYKTIKTQLGIEKESGKRGSIILNFVKDHYLRQLVNIDDFLNVRDIIYFESTAEYLNQFKN